MMKLSDIDFDQWFQSLVSDLRQEHTYNCTPQGHAGKGKRMIVPHGRYDPKYQITVPVDREGETL